MAQRKKSDVAVLLGYAGSHRGLTYLGLALSAVSMLLSMAPYICIWLAARDLIAVAPNWTQAQNVAGYGWIAFAFAVGGIVIYVAGLMCTHLAAFRTASNIRKQGVARVMKAPLGFFDSNASGLIRSRLDAAAADTEQLLAHNLADIVGTIEMCIRDSICIGGIQRVHCRGSVRIILIINRVRSVSYTHLDVYKRQVWCRSYVASAIFCPVSVKWPSWASSKNR